MTPSNLVLAASVAFLLTALGTPAFRRLASSRGLVDRPNPRSSHTGVVASGGGLLLLLAAGVGLALIPVPWSGAALALAAGAVLVGGVGLWDDRRGVSPPIRLAFQVLAASILVWHTGGLAHLPLPPPLDLEIGKFGGTIAILWIVAVVNFYNFLDGIDGLASLQGVVTGAGVAAAAWAPFSSALAVALAGGCLGFLLHNWSPARVFLGDVGSGALGFCFAAAPFLAPAELRPSAVLFVAFSLWLFLADATLTLFRRLLRGARIHEAHREHLYQLLVVGGWSHPQVSVLIGLGSTVMTLVALLAWRSMDVRWFWAGIALGAALFAGELALARRATS